MDASTAANVATGTATVETSVGATGTDSENSRELTRTWIEQQLQVARRVVVRPDPSLDGDEAVDGFYAVSALEDSGGERGAPSCRLYGGVDVSFPSDPRGDAVAVYVIVNERTGNVVYQDHARFALTMPYIPSFLAFREIEAFEELVRKQLQGHPELRPRAILVDGNGIFHVRHAGIACFLGVRTGVPTIGVGKTLYYMSGWTRSVMDEFLDSTFRRLDAAVGLLEQRLGVDNGREAQERILVHADTCMPPLSEKHSSGREAAAEMTVSSADRSAVLERAKGCCRGVAIRLGSRDSQHRVLACALVGHGGRVGKRRKAGTKNPIFVSVGHDISLLEAVRVCCALSTARVPEPVRQADLVGREMIRQMQRTNEQSLR